MDLWLDSYWFFLVTVRWRTLYCFYFLQQAQADGVILGTESLQFGASQPSIAPNPRRTNFETTT